MSNAPNCHPALLPRGRWLQQRTVDSRAVYMDPNVDDVSVYLLVGKDWWRFPPKSHLAHVSVAGIPGEMQVLLLLNIVLPTALIPLSSLIYSAFRSVCLLVGFCLCLYKTPFLFSCSPVSVCAESWYQKSRSSDLQINVDTLIWVFQYNLTGFRRQAITYGRLFS